MQICRSMKYNTAILEKVKMAKPSGALDGALNQNFLAFLENLQEKYLFAPMTDLIA